MVIVEFFSQVPIENMISALTNAPERVVFVGESKRMKKYDSVFHRFLESVGNTTTQLEYRNVKIHKLSEIVRVIEQIVMDYPGCHFDLTGGDDLSMTAIGIIYERYRNRGIELHQYNIRTGAVYDCDLNGQSVSGKIPSLTVEQNIILHGGSIVSAEQRKNGTYLWDFNDDFVRDIYTMWDICRDNCGVWNYQISMVRDMLPFNCDREDPLHLHVVISQVREYFSKRGFSLNLKGIFSQLEKAGLISDLNKQNDVFSLTFKNEQVRMCLTKAGTILELVVYLAAQKVTGRDETPYYTDAMTGVFIDWDGIVHDDGQNDETDTADRIVDTENEIDVLLMHGAVPVFISCKNGGVGEEELYKLNTVAERFGSSYAKKVLIGTTLGRGSVSRKYFLERAKDMKIQVIDGVQNMTEDGLIRRLKSLA